LDLPFYQQYWRYLQGLLHGDLDARLFSAAK
jgi:peptide/nickel transport system permease protein